MLKKANFPVAVMARVLEVTRAGYYVWVCRGANRRRRSRSRRLFDQAVSDEFHRARGVYGAPRLTVVLSKHGIDANQKTVAASLKRLGLEAVSTRQFYHRAGKKTSPCVHAGYCQRSWDQGGMNRVWVTDFTYLRCGEGWVYLVAVRDAHSRRVLGYAMGERQDTSLVIHALTMAIETRGSQMPGRVVLHADRGCQFTSHELTQYAKRVGVTLSVGKTGVYWDNAMAESFWASLKIEYFYRHAFTTRHQVYDGVSEWIDRFYNHQRVHSAINMMTPVEYKLHATNRTMRLAA